MTKFVALLVFASLFGSFAIAADVADIDGAYDCVYAQSDDKLTMIFSNGGTQTELSADGETLKARLVDSSASLSRHEKEFGFVLVTVMDKEEILGIMRIFRSSNGYLWIQDEDGSWDNWGQPIDRSKREQLGFSFMPGSVCRPQ